MKTILLFLFSIFTCHIMIAQQLTENQALAFSEKLYQVEILSEKGRDALKERIEKDRLPAYGEVEREGYSTDTDLSASAILNFLASAFGADFYFRSGMSIEIRQAIQEKFYKDKDTEEMTEAEFEALKPEIQAFMLTFEGPRIEAAIPVEDSLLEGGFTFYPGMMPEATENGWIHPKRSVWGKTRTRTIKELLQIGLIDHKIYNDVFPKVKSGELFTEALMLNELATRANYYEHFDENKAEELKFIQKLRDAAIISDSNYQKLLTSYKDFDIKTPADYLPFCNNAVIFDSIEADSTDPFAFYAKVFPEIKKLLPDFNYKNLSVEIIENPDFPDKELIEQNCKIIFEVDGIKYMNRFFHNYIKKNPDNEDLQNLAPEINPAFHKGVNKWLADRNSEQRLYYFNGLLLMTKAQYDIWNSFGHGYFIYSENHDNTFNTKNIQQFIQEYEQIGLFSHLTDAEIAEGKNKVLASEINSYQSILSCFPKMLVIFDWESGNLENPYEELTQEFAAASRGAFTPTDIVDHFAKDWEAEKEKTLYSFKFKGKTYQQELDLQNDWLDPMFMELIDKALEDNKVDGKIYYCVNDGQVGGYIFLTLSQYSYLKTKHPTLFEE